MKKELTQRQRRLTGSIRALPLRYGENGWQAAVLIPNERELRQYTIVAGEEHSLSATNLTDMGRAINLLEQLMLQSWATDSFPFPGAVTAAVGIKHGNPCGASTHPHTQAAVEQMVEGSPRALFGGTIATTCLLDEEVAHILVTHKAGGRRPLDIVLAPACTDGALRILRRKEDRCKVLINKEFWNLSGHIVDYSPRRIHTRFGDIVQESSMQALNFNNPDLQVYGKSCDTITWCDLGIAAAICRSSNSNTVTLVKDRMLIGQGQGQGERALASELAVMIAKRNGHTTKGAVACSDSFFPFADGVEPLIKAGVKAIFSTSGSIRDKEVQDACIKAGVTLYQLPDKDARMFFGHS